MRSARLILLALLSAGVAAGTAFAQTGASGSGKIYCWKNKSGKTECGDSIPLEHQDAAVRELNKRGITVKQTEAALTPEQKKAQQAELERKQVEEQRKEEQRRKDKALLDTFSNEQEIDLKRGREIQLLEGNIETLLTNLKNASERHTDSRARADGYTKRNTAVPQPVLDEVARTSNDKMQIEKQIAQKRRDIVALNKWYDDLKKRFNELKGAPPAADQGSSKSATGTAR